MKTLSLSHHLYIPPELSREDAGDLTDRLMVELVDLGVDDPAHPSTTASTWSPSTERQQRGDV